MTINDEGELEYETDEEEEWKESEDSSELSVEEPVIIQSDKRKRKGEPSDVSKSKKPKPDIVITSNDLECKECGKTFTRKDNMKRHVTRVH